MNNPKSRVEREVDLIVDRAKEKGKTLDEYELFCVKSALAVYNFMEEQNHSGLSFAWTTNYLIRMLHGLPLSPITEADEFAPNELEPTIEHCVRYPSLTRRKDEGGNYVYSDSYRLCTKTGDLYYHAERILDDMFPIKLPYYPSTEKFIIEDEDFDTNGEVGCVDTIGIFSITPPRDKKTEVNKFYKEDVTEWKEIDFEEYMARKSTSNAKFPDSLSGEKQGNEKGSL